MKIGFLAWGNQKVLDEGVSAAAFHRINLLKQFCEADGHETEWRWQGEFSSRGSLAWFAKKKQLADWIQSCDAVYAGSTDPAALAVAAVPSGRRVIYDCHTPAIGENLMLFRSQKTVRNFLLYIRTLVHESMAARRARVITTVSDSAIRYFHKTFHREMRDLFLVRNAIDFEEFRPMEMPMRDRAHFLYTGGMDRWQGIPDLIEAFAGSEKNCDLTIIGFDESHETLRLRAEAVGITALRRMPREQALQHFREAHFGVTATPGMCAKLMPGAFPTKWAEYLALGRAVAVTNAYDCATLTKELNCGLVMDPGPKGIREGLRRASETTREDRVEMAERGRVWVTEECSIEKAGASFLRAARIAAGGS